MRKSAAKSIGCSFLVLLALSLGSGCAVKGGGGTSSDSLAARGDNAPSGDMVDKRVRDYLEANMDSALESNDPQARSVLMRTARTALGTPYVPGGTSTAGFDCSGFVQWTFNHVGVKLPRTAREQSRVGRAIRNIDDMQVGDIVAFRHPKRGYHTGIYVGDGKFIHSPRRRTTVRINDLSDPYFSGTFLGARRVAVSNEADIEAAERMLAEYRVREKNTAHRLSAEKSQKSTRNDKNRAGKKQLVAERGASRSDAAAARSGSRSKTSAKEKVSTSREKASPAKAKAADAGNDRKKPAGRQQSKDDAKKTAAKESGKKAAPKADSKPTAKTDSKKTAKADATAKKNTQAAR